MIKELGSVLAGTMLALTAPSPSLAHRGPETPGRYHILDGSLEVRDNNLAIMIVCAQFRG